MKTFQQLRSVLLLAVLGGGLALGAIPARAEPEELNKHLNLSAGDSHFVKEVAGENQKEIKLGQWAAEKAGSKSVKEFAQKLVSDHTKAGAELKSICDLKGIVLESGGKGGEGASAGEDFSGLSGTAFDQAYVRHLVGDHEKNIKEFERESTHGDDRQIREFAAKMLPTLKMHLAAGKALSVNLNASLENIIGEPAGAAPPNPASPPKSIEKKDNDARGQPNTAPFPSEQK